MMRSLIASLTTGLILLGCYNMVAQNLPESTVQFRGRSIDLEPYINGFPYRDFSISYDADKLFYFHDDSTSELLELPLSGQSDLRAGKRISDIDFSKRNIWGVNYNKRDKHLYLFGDENNDEVINLFRLNPQTKVVEKITNVPFIYGYQWDKEQKQIAFIARLGHREQQAGELRILDLETMQETVLMQDTPEYRFTWSEPSWQPDGNGLVLTVLSNMDRNAANLIHYDFQSKKWALVTDPKKPRNFPHADQQWLSPTEFNYFSNEDGNVNLYRYNIVAKKSSQITHFKTDISSAGLLNVDNKKIMLAILQSPVKTELCLIDPVEGKIINRHISADRLDILDTENNKAILLASSTVEKFRIDELVVNNNSFAFTNKASMSKQLKQSIVHSTVERVEFATFDVDPKTGKSRMLHAYLYKPDNPLPTDQQMVMILSFYGGENEFNNKVQILTHAGIYVFSPAPRGCSGFGREFSALNDRDLGGNEIIDIIYAGKYISEKLGIPPERVGVFGRSHGGYATMRLLTFPGEINGVKANFDWGFGIATAGFSDIIHFYEHCNIPDWVLLEAGDPATEIDKLNDRSPLYHADKMRGKLLLVHGSNDSRVPVAGSRQMAEALQKHGKDVTYIEFPDQGHRVKGIKNEKDIYTAWFDFLENVK